MGTTYIVGMVFHLLYYINLINLTMIPFSLKRGARELDVARLFLMEKTMVALRD
jgi:hypothetical protein